MSTGEEAGGKSDSPPRQIQASSLLGQPCCVTPTNLCQKQTWDKGDLLGIPEKNLDFSDQIDLRPASNLIYNKHGPRSWGSGEGGEATQSSVRLHSSIVFLGWEGPG